MLSMYSEKVYEKIFTNKISKQAYLDACKWLAKNVYGSKYSDYLTVQIQKQEQKKKEEEFTFVVTVYACVNESEIKKKHCSKCQQFYTLFYCVDKPKCEECKYTVYKKSREQEIKNIRNSFEEVFKENEEWENC